VVPARRVERDHVPARYRRRHNRLRHQDSLFMYEQPPPGLRVGHHPAGVAWWQRTARERSLLNRGSCCEDEISSAAPDPGGKNYSPGGVNEARRPRGGGRQPIGCPCAPGIGTAGDAGAQRAVTERVPHNARFALAKFRPTTLPTTLLTRPTLLGRLEAGASQRLTVVVGSAGAGKSVLVSSWTAARDGG